MSLRCMNCRSRLALIAAGHASESERLEVESHLQGCAACREEEARWGVISQLRVAPLQQLSSDARERVRRAMVYASVQQQAARAVERRPLWGWRAGLVGAAAAAAVLVTVGITSYRHQGQGAEVVTGDVAVAGVPAWSGTAIADQQTVESQNGGTVRLDGPIVRLAAGTRLSWNRKQHDVRLDSGQVTVDVDPRLGIHFRVSTEQFAAEVLGTRFVATTSTVFTERGKVRVVGRDGAELAVLTAGQRWSMPAPAPATPPVAAVVSPLPVTSPAAAPPVAAAPAAPAPAPAPVAVAEHRHGHVRAASSTSAAGAADAPLAAILDQARDAVAHGNTADARRLLGQLMHRKTSAYVDAEARMVYAEAAMVDKRPDEQLRRLREVVRMHPSLPQAEDALFAQVQFEVEAGHQAEARRSIAEYLGRYPHGQFLGEVRSRQSRLDRQ